MASEMHNYLRDGVKGAGYAALWFCARSAAGSRGRASRAARPSIFVVDIPFSRANYLQGPLQKQPARVGSRTQERRWPLARTEWTKFYLHTGDGSLSTEAPAERSAADFEALGEGLTFTAEPVAEQTEITGPAAARIVAASSTTDADFFLTLRVLDPEGHDVRFVSALDPGGVVAHGWLRGSHRAVDAEKTLPYRPWHPHDSLDPLPPGEPVSLDIEIWPTSVVVPAGYRLAVTVQGRDFEFPGDGPWPESYGVPMKGQAIFLHADPVDRPTDVFGGVTTLVSGGDEPSYLLLPVIPRSPEHPEGVRRGPFPEHA